MNSDFLGGCAKFIFNPTDQTSLFHFLGILIDSVLCLIKISFSVSQMKEKLTYIQYVEKRHISNTGINMEIGVKVYYILQWLMWSL